MNKTKIDWCDSTWNPVTGCLHGCEYCYARTIAERFKAREPGKFGEEKTDGHYKYELNSPLLVRNDSKNGCTKAAYPYGFSPTLYRYRLDDYATKNGRNIFVCSMADLFGDWVPDAWIQEVFEACWKAPQHNYLFLTKNPQRYERYGVPFDKNFWYGTSVCKKSDIAKCTHLPIDTNRFISVEPILEDLDIVDSPLIDWVHWVIIGAETGRRKDKVVPDRKWIENIVNECRKNKKPVFMKSSLAPIWGEPLIQEFPKELSR